MPRLRTLVLPLLLVLPLAACGTSPSETEEAAAPAAAGAFPVTLEHAFGETVVEQAPQRLVTWGWGSADAAIALGTVPVAMTAQAYAGDADKVLPWVRERLEADGAAMPTVLPDTQEVPVEAIAAARPDLILAPYSGVTETEYAALTKIAPTVAYPGEAWATPWRETIEIVGTALGKAPQAEQLLADIDEQVAAQAKAHPELAGKSVALVANTPQEFYVYRQADPRVTFAESLGLTTAPAVDALATGDDTFFYTLSTERLDELQSDLLITFAASPEESKAFLDSPAAKLMPQVRAGAVAEVVGPQLVSSVSPPTALSLPWGLEDYVAALSKAATAA